MTDRIFEGALRQLIADQSGDNKTLLHDFSAELFNSIQQGLLQHGHLRLHNFGSYQLKWSKQRNGKHPKTGEVIVIPAQPRIVFTPAKALKDKVNQDSPSIPTAIISNPVTIKPVEITTPAENITPSITTERKPVDHIAPYLSKNIARKAETQQKQPPVKAIAAAVFVGLFVFYFLQTDKPIPSLPASSETVTTSITPQNTTQAIVSAETITTDSETHTISGISSETTAEELTSNNQEAPSDLTITTTDADSVNNALNTYQGTEKTDGLTTSNDIYFKARNHKLVDGDSLWRLSKKSYINPFYWPHIYQANRYTIKNPNKVIIGNTIELPSLFGNPENLTAVDRRNIAEGYFLLYLHYKKTNKNFPYYALLGAAKFDPEIIKEHDFEIAEEDWESLQIAGN